MKKRVSVMLFVILAAVSTSMLSSHFVKATPGTIYIRPDGSVEGTGKIQHDGDVYTFTDDIYDEIVIERSNITVDGNEHTLQGSGSGFGFYWSGVNNVTVRNTQIESFETGIYLNQSNHSSIHENIIRLSRYGIVLNTSSCFNAVSENIIRENWNDGIRVYSPFFYFAPSNNNTISGNTIADNEDYGVAINMWCRYNNVSGNNITNNGLGLLLAHDSDFNTVSRNNITKNISVTYPDKSVNVYIYASSNNDIFGNRITDSWTGIALFTLQPGVTDSSYNTVCDNLIASNKRGIVLIEASDNTFYHNIFLSNAVQVNNTTPDYGNSWDDGYPSGGNYWSDYEDRYPDANELDGSGIWDTPYEIDANNTDNYPLMSPSEDIALVKRYFPIYKFSATDPWYPCSFYFDNNTDLYNKDSYEDYTPFPPPYYAYVHIIENATHKAIQYWLYSVYNQHNVWRDHDSEWDSTIFIILEKTDDEPVPVEVYYFFHLNKEHRSWNDWPEKEDTTHPVVYVANGSHGAYSEPDEMINNRNNLWVDDVWVDGGKVLREENFSWYLVGHSEDHTHRDEPSGTYCDMTVEWIEGEPQWEFDNHWWPEEFPCYAEEPMDPPWHQSDWMRVQPVESWLEFFGFSPINLLVTDPDGLEVGYDPQSGESVFEIPGALYSGPDATPEIVMIPDPIYGNYTTEIIGIETGTYNLTVSRVVGDVEIYHEELNDIPIEQNQTQSITTLTFSHADISVMSVDPFKTIVGQGYCTTLNVTLQNQGAFPETFNLTTYYNSNAINYTTITLTTGNSTTVTFTWNTTGVARGNYTIRAYATPIPGETDIADNTLTDGGILVTIIGDINGDGLVDIVDLVLVIKHYGSYPDHPSWNPNADINGDGLVDIVDLVKVIKYYGTAAP